VKIFDVVSLLKRFFTDAFYKRGFSDAGTAFQDKNFVGFLLRDNIAVITEETKRSVSTRKKVPGFSLRHFNSSHCR
jgi:hypothetical protein